MNGADIIAGIILAAIVIAVLAYLLHWLYRRSTKDVSFVRTGLGGEKVIMGGGAFILPIVHDITEVSMNTLRLQVTRVGWRGSRGRSGNRRCAHRVWSRRLGCGILGKTIHLVVFPPIHPCSAEPGG